MKNVKVMVVFRDGNNRKQHELIELNADWEINLWIQLACAARRICLPHENFLHIIIRGNDDGGRMRVKHFQNKYTTLSYWQRSYLCSHRCDLQ